MRFDLHLGCLLTVLASCALPPRALTPAAPKSAGPPPPLPPTRMLEGITFAVDPGELYVSVEDLRKKVFLPVRWKAEQKALVYSGKQVDDDAVRTLLDGSRVVTIRGLKEVGVPFGWDAAWDVPVLTHKKKRFWVREGTQRIVVNRAKQRLRCYQGGRLLGETKVSTGASGFRTPTGAFTAGPFKAVMHYSRQYDMAPMPFTVQVYGNICMHGSASVPSYPASHGCIRLPLTGANPARWIYRWVGLGSAVIIAESWDPEEFGAADRRRKRTRRGRTG